MANVQLDITTEADPTGTIIESWTDEDITELRLAISLYDLGRNSVRVPRSFWDSTSLDASKTYYVRVKLPYIFASGYVWGFWLQAGEFILVDEDEEGGEFVTIGGPGPAWILTKAILNWREYDNPSSNIYVFDGSWWFEDRTYGRILEKLINEDAASPRPALAGMDTPGWSGSLDSDGNPWEDFPGIYKREVGDDYYTIIRDLQKGDNLDAWVGANLDLRAVISQGFDRSGASFGSGVVRFVKGVNIVGDLSRDKDSGKAFTHVLVLGNDRRTESGRVIEGRPIHVWVVDPDWQEGDAIRQGFASYDTNSRLVLENRGKRLIRRSKDRSGRMASFEIMPGDDEANGFYLPGGPATDKGKFWIGDYITVDTGTGTNDFDFNEARLRIATIRIELAQASTEGSDEERERSLRVFIDTGDDPSPSRSADSSSGENVGGGLRCNCISLCGTDTEEATTGVFESAGPSGQTTGSPLTLTCPATVNAGDLLVAHVQRESHGTIDTPSGWTLHASADQTPDLRAMLFYRVADGTEDNTNVLFAASALGTAKYGRIYRFSGSTTLGTVTSSSGASASTVTAPDVTGSAGTLGLLFVGLGQNQAVGDMSGESGVDWTEAVAESNESTGLVQLQTGTLVADGSVGGSMSVAAGTDFLVLGTTLGEGNTTSDNHADLMGTGNRAARCDHRHVLFSASDPTVNDDENDDLSIGTLWFNTTDNGFFILEDATGGAAVWSEIGAGGSDHGSLSGLGDDDHPQYLTEADHTALSHEELGHWEVIVSGTAPPVAVSNPADDDWLYGWVSD